MQEADFNIITKYLSKETSKEEDKLLLDKMKNDLDFKIELEETSAIWNSVEFEEKSFDKNRINKLIDHKISINKMQNRNRIINISLKYAAIFIGIIMLSMFVYSDLNNVKIIVNNTNKIQKIKLPDNSIISLNKNARIEYQNSVLKSFNRQIKLQGEAYFEIAKAEGEKFIVETEDYNIEVLGTKFNVNTSSEKKSIVLTEGKVVLNNFDNKNTEFSMKPNEIVYFSKENQKFEKKTVNSKIYTSWLTNKLEFDNFSLQDLSELIKIRYNKELIFKNNNVRLSGTAPSDDINMIVKALETILNTQITQNNNQLIIN